MDFFQCHTLLAVVYCSPRNYQLIVSKSERYFDIFLQYYFHFRFVFFWTWHGRLERHFISCPKSRCLMQWNFQPWRLPLGMKGSMQSRYAISNLQSLNEWKL